jgi:hypothetical protein
VETDDFAVRDFATRNLMELMKQHHGMPVGILVEPMMKKIQLANSNLLTVIDMELFLVIAKHPRCTPRHAEMLAQVLSRVAVESPDFGRSASVPLLTILHRFSDEDLVIGFFEHFLQITLTRLIQKTTPKIQVMQIHEALAKIACLRKPRLGAVLIQMLGDISRAYLMNFEALHPNLQALLELFPSEDAAVHEWARQQFSEALDAPMSEKGNDDTMVLRSVTPSLHNEPQDAPGSNVSRPDMSSMGRQKSHSPGRGDDSARGKSRSPSSPRAHSVSFDQDEPGRKSDADQMDDAGYTDGSMKHLAQETEALRQELEKARERQLQSVEEAKTLRSQLEEAKRLQQQVGKEVSELQQRRGDILKKQAEKGPGGKRSDKQKGKKGDVGDEEQKVKLLMQAFQAPLQIMFNSYAKSRRTVGGASLAIDALEQLLTDLELLPSKIQKKAVPDLVRKAKPRSRDEIQFHEFLVAFPFLAGKAFSPGDAEPFLDFGVPVPIDDDPPLHRQSQAFLQHIGKMSQTSKIAFISSAQPAFTEALRMWVYKYAQSVLDSLNGRLKKGAELNDHDLPEGFEILFCVPDPTYSIPEGLPIPKSERHCVEILDDILARAVGLHFLEPAGKAAGPVQMAAVKGHQKLSDLAIEPSATLKLEQPDGEASPPRQRSKRPGGQDDGGRRGPRRAAGQDAQAKREARQDPKREARGRRQQREPRPGPGNREPQDSAASKEPQDSAERRQRRPPRRDAAPARAALPPPDEPAVNEPQGRSPRRPPARQERGVSADRAAPRRTSPGDARSDASPSPAAPAAKRQRQPKRAAAPKRGSDAGQDSGQEAPPAKRGSEAARGSVAGRDRQLLDRATEAKVTKDRQTAMQEALKSPELQKLFKQYSSGMKRVFEFFSKWKGGLSEEGFPEAMLLCAIRQVEISLGGAQIELADEKPMWTRTLRALFQHMLMNNPQVLRAELDKFRKTGDTQSKFDPESPTLPPGAKPGPQGKAGGEEAAASEASAPAVQRQKTELDAEASPPADSSDKAADGADEAGDAAGEPSTLQKEPSLLQKEPSLLQKESSLLQKEGAAAADGEAKPPEGDAAAAEEAKMDATEGEKVGGEAAAEGAGDPAAGGGGKLAEGGGEAAPDAAAELAPPAETEKEGEAAPASGEAAAVTEETAAAESTPAAEGADAAGEEAKEGAAETAGDAVEATA